MDVVADAKALTPNPAAGDAEQAQQRLAVPDDHPDRRDVGPRRASTRSRPSRSAPGPTSLRHVEPRRLDHAQAQRHYWGKQPATSRPSSLKYFKDPHRAQQRAADRHHQRDRHGAGARVARAVHRATASTRSSRAPPTARSCCRSTTPRPAERPQAPPGDPHGDRPQGPDGHLLGRHGHADRQHGPADRPLVRGPHRRLPATTWPRPRRCSPSRAARRRRCGSGPDAAVRGRLRPGGQEPARAGRHQGATSTSSSSRRRGCRRCSRTHDYDMSIVAHVEPRDLPAVFGNPKYYTRYNNPTAAGRHRGRRRRHRPTSR